MRFDPSVIDYIAPRPFDRSIEPPPPIETVCSGLQAESVRESVAICCFANFVQTRVDIVVLQVK